MTLHQMPMKLKGWTQVEDSSRGVISILGTAHQHFIHFPCCALADGPSWSVWDWFGK